MRSTAFALGLHDRPVVASLLARHNALASATVDPTPRDDNRPLPRSQPFEPSPDDRAWEASQPSRPTGPSKPPAAPQTHAKDHSPRRPAQWGEALTGSTSSLGLGPAQSARPDRPTPHDTAPAPTPQHGRHTPCVSRLQRPLPPCPMTTCRAPSRPSSQQARGAGCPGDPDGSHHRRRRHVTRQGIQPRAHQAMPTRIEGKGDFTRHMLRFRHTDHMGVSGRAEIPEVVMVNSHDGTSAASCRESFGSCA